MWAWEARRTTSHWRLARAWPLARGRVGEREGHRGNKKKENERKRNDANLHLMCMDRVLERRRALGACVGERTEACRSRGVGTGVPEKRSCCGFWGRVVGEGRAKSRLFFGAFACPNLLGRGRLLCEDGSGECVCRDGERGRRASERDGLLQRFLALFLGGLPPRLSGRAAFAARDEPSKETKR